MCKLLSTILLILTFVSSSTSVQALDYRLHSPYFHKTEWDQLYLKEQIQGAVYLRAKIEKLEQENEQLRNSINNLRNVAKYQIDMESNSRIQALIEENKRLSSIIARKEKQGNAQKDACIIGNAPDLSQKELKQKRVEIKLLQRKVEDIQEENRNLAQTLAASSAKLLDYQDKINSIGSDNSKSHKEMSILRKKLAYAEGKNEELKAEIEKIRVKLASSKHYGQKDIDALKEQNQSLRKTIAAQSKTLLSADNAIKTAEKLLIENKQLQTKLERSKQENQLEGISYKERFFELKKENENLETKLNKAQENAIAYRTKIREYQNEIEAVKLKNQELRARIELSSKRKQTPATAMLKDMKGSDHDEHVTFISAPYPPVEQVKPVLDRNGNHISYDRALAIAPEEILTQDIKPLPRLNNFE